MKVSSPDNEVNKELQRMIRKEERQGEVKARPIEIDGKEFKLVEEV